MYRTVGEIPKTKCSEKVATALSENKTTRTSDAQPAARVLLRFTILAYFSFIIATIFGLWSLLAAYRGAEGIIYTLVPLSPFYLGFSLVVIPHVWYLYRDIKRRMGSEGPSVGVGVVVPTVTGYSIFVLGPLLGVYPSTVSAIIIDILGDYIGPGAYVGYSVTAILLGPFHIALLYVLVAQEDGHLPRKKVESESGTTGKEDMDTFPPFPDPFVRLSNSGSPTSELQSWCFRRSGTCS